MPCWWTSRACGRPHASIRRRPARHGRLLGRQGTTLIEAMASIAILSIVALGTAAFISHAQARTVLQSFRFTALQQATARLEQIRRATGSTIAPTTQNYSVWYLDYMTGAPRLSTANPGETVSIGGQLRPMATTVQYMDPTGGATLFVCLRIRVQIQCGREPDETVTLETIEAL